ncbi:MAG: DUF5104 domain-containing protein [Anaeroplasmataceae bacterium]|nr:DUF5104 domain-containing protein [Anaeroplasmataceae bacterium]
MHNKLIQRICLIGFVFLFIGLLPGCSIVDTESESEKIIAKSNEIMRCFIERDQESFNHLFCERVKNSEGFQEQSDAVFSLFECDTYVGAQINTTASGGKAWGDGGVIEWDVAPYINWIKTLVEEDSPMGQERYYEIIYFWQIVDKENPEEEGLHYLTLTLLNHSEVTVGQIGSVNSETNEQEKV